MGFLCRDATIYLYHATGFSGNFPVGPSSQAEKQPKERIFRPHIPRTSQNDLCGRPESKMSNVTSMTPGGRKKKFGRKISSWFFSLYVSVAVLGQNGKRVQNQKWPVKWPVAPVKESHNGIVTIARQVLGPFLFQFSNVVVLNAVVRKNTQTSAKSANDRKRAQTRVCKRAQKSVFFMRTTNFENSQIFRPC